MIRPITLVTAVMFALSGAYLFAVKHRSQTLDDQLSTTAEATRLDAQRIRVLQAQWALEVDPSRLAQLSTQFIGTLQPMKPSQLVTLAALTSALPAPGSAVPGDNPEDAIPVTPEAPAVDAPVASAANPAVSGSTGPQVASAAVAAMHVASAARSPAHVENSAPRQHMQMASVEALLHKLPDGRRAMRLRHEAINREYAENRPSYGTQMASALAPQPVMSSGLAPQAPMGAQVMSVRAVSAPAPAPAQAPMDGGGSLLGMAQEGSN
jgi:hypothetical protein